MATTGTMEGEEVAKFNEWFNKNYYRVKQFLQSWCFFSTYNWSEDDFHNMYISIINSITNGKKLDYKTIDNYIFIAYKNTLIKQTDTAYVKNRNANYNSTNIHMLPLKEEDEDEKAENEEQFQKLYNFLCIVEKDVYNACGESIGAVFSKKFDNQLLDIQNGDRKKFEEAKKYIREKWGDYYKNNIKLKKSNQ